MKKKKSKKIEDTIDITLVPQLQSDYIHELQTNPIYSLEVDPEGKYKMSAVEKEFLLHYINYKSIMTAAELAGIEPDVARQFFVSYPAQQEIRRINRALYHRQFANRLLSIDEIGGYLTSLLMDENVPVADQLKTTDKLRVADMIIDLNKLKQEGMQSPGKLMERDIEVEIKELSVEAIQALLISSSTLKQKNNAIAELDPKSQLTIEERSYLSTLPLKDLLEMVESTKRKGGNNGTQ